MRFKKAIQYRLPRYDYSQDGAYFITIRIHRWQHHFGKIQNSRMQYSPLGKIAKGYWLEIPKHFPFVHLDTFKVMPNHIHGILVILKRLNRAQLQNFETDEDLALKIVSEKEVISNTKYKNNFGFQSKNLASIIRGYKAAVKKRATMNKISFKWHRRFHDRIIRNTEELERIREYIRNNPEQWEVDKNQRISQS